jgi:hypothetical protein
MEFRVLHAAVVKPETPRCEAMRKTPYANDHIKTDYQCSFASLYVINGKCLCTKHAGAELLRLHTEGLI